MPFKSEKQRRYLWANEPEIARDWTDTYGSRIEKNDGGITQLVKSGPGRPGYGGPHETEAAGKSYERATAPGGEGAGAWQQQALQQHRTQQQARGKGKEQQKAEKRAQKYKDKKEKQKQKDKKAELKALKLQNKKKQAFVKYLKKDWVNQPHMDPEEVADMLESQFEVTIDPETGEKEYTFTGDAIGTGFQKGTKYNMPTDTQLGPFGLKDKGVKGDPLSTKYLDRTPDFDSIIKMPLGLQVLGLGKPNYNTLLSTFNRMDTLGDINTQEGWNKYWDDARARHITPGGGDGGYMGYPSYAAWLAAQGGGGGGGGGTTAATTTDTPSAFQASLTDTADTPDYYVGNNPLASNIAWGQKFGVDPRTMGRTSWAADGGRIGRAYGGIMDNSTGRRAYGLGSVFKSIKKAASKVLKSPIGKAALIGAGAYFMPGIGAKAAGGWAPWAQGLKSKWGIKQLLTKEGLGKAWDPWKLGIMGASALPFFMGGQDEDEDEGFDYMGAKNEYRDELMRIKAGAMAGTLDPNKFVYQGVKDGGRIGYYAGGQSTPSDYTVEDAMMTTTQDKLGGITDVMKQADLNRQGSVGQFYAADGGRIGFRYGKTYGSKMESSNRSALEKNIEWLMTEMGLSRDEAIERVLSSFRRSETPSRPFEFSEDMIADMKSRVYPSQIKDKGERIAEPFYPDRFEGERIAEPFNPNDPKWENLKPELMAQGGRIRYDAGGQTGHPPITTGQVPQVPPQMPAPPPRPHPMPAPQPNRMAMNPMMNRPMMNPMMGGRRMAQEGGLMDLGGMEKDYRNDGGFVPIGGEEKADDVPARLSKNEFVFTADAVRGAGDGDIDKGAEIMENIMKNLEQGGQISEETQGLTGAQEMFGVSERLSEVV
jgi:hypothetical protein